MKLELSVKYNNILYIPLSLLGPETRLEKGDVLGKYLCKNG